jgi:CheY-like chemotaxis protein
MIYAENFKKITALSVNFNEIDKSELMVYEVELNDFIEKFPLKASKLKYALIRKDYEVLSNGLYEVSNLLAAIKADALEKKCLRIIADLKATDIDSAEAEITAFLAGATALSIDIQMAFHAGETAAVAAPVNNNEQKLILAVDDAPFILQTLKINLQDMPYKLVCVTSGADALRFIEKKNPDLYILDVEMPEMDGYELAAEIKEKDKTAPIIFLTGNSDKESVAKALTVGAADFIIKPISKEQIISRISKFI